MQQFPLYAVQWPTWPWPLNQSRHAATTSTNSETIGSFVDYPAFLDTGALAEHEAAIAVRRILDKLVRRFRYGAPCVSAMPFSHF